VSSKAIAAGAKGYVDEAASAGRVLSRLCASSIKAQCGRLGRVLSTFIERGQLIPRAASSPPDASPSPTAKKEVLEMLVAGRSNKENRLRPSDIEERTVKAHVAKLMRKVGVQNRIALSVHAITHSLVTAK